MTTKNMAYDHPAYLVRTHHGFGQNVAGASTNFGKFVAYANMTLFSVTGALATAGTSTTTAWNGTATGTAINGDSFNVIHVLNGTAVTTTTHGPFALAGGAAGTNTATAGLTVNVALSGTGTSGNVQAGTNTATGGVLINQGDTLHILRGTDATAVSAYTLELGVQPFANVTA